MRHWIANSLVLGMAMIGGIAIGFELDNETPQVIVVPQIIEVTSPPVYIETVVKEIQVIEKPIYPEPRQFESTYDYFNWLDNYDFEKRKWKAGYDCDDFTIDWWLACAGDGWLAGFATNSAHMQGAVVIEGWLWKVEPQNRTIQKWVPLDRK